MLYFSYKDIGIVYVLWKVISVVTFTASSHQLPGAAAELTAPKD